MSKSLVVAAAVCAAVCAHALKPNQFEKRFSLTLSEVPEAAVGCPAVLPVRLSEETIDGFRYAEVAEGGADLRFADAEGNEYPFEIDTWNPEGESIVWVRVPTLAASTILFCYYGVRSEDYLGEISSPWSDYIGVYHLTDLSPSGLTGSLVSSGSGNAKPVSGTRYGSGNNLAANNAYLAIPKADVRDNLPDRGVFTIQAWVKAAGGTTPSHGLRLFNAKATYTDVGFDVMYFSNSSAPNKIACRGNAATTTAYFDASAIDWSKTNLFQVAYNGATVSCYVNGQALSGSTAIDPVTEINYEVKVGSGPGQALLGVYDELRLRPDALTAAQAAADYAAERDDAIAYGAVTASSDTYPTLKDAKVAWNGTGYCVSVALTAGQGSLHILLTNGAGDTQDFLVAENLPVSETALDYSFAGDTLAENTAYQIALEARNDLGETTTLTLPYALYTGSLAVTKTADTAEVQKDPQPGTFTISLPDGAEPPAYPIEVHLDLSGTAVAGLNYRTPELLLTIPAGAQSATLSIEPLIAHPSDADTIVTCTIATGAYRQENPSSADMTIANLPVPEDYNVWVAQTDGLASNPANWSGGLPSEQDHILIDSDYSTAVMTWDAGVNGLPDTVASFTQAANVAATNLIATTYDDSFPLFTVSGDLKIMGGALAHLPNSAAPAYRLALAVGGNFTLAQGATIDGWQRGMGVKQTATANGKIGIHAGASQKSTAGTVVGNVYEPVLVGNGGGNANPSYPGGGAFWLSAQGDVTLDGTIDVRSFESANTWAGAGCGAPGSVYVKGRTIAGNGLIKACGSTVARRGTETTSGGRVALIATGSDTLSFPVANVSYYGSRGTFVSGGGTLFVKTSASTHGALHLDNYPKKIADTCGLGLPEFASATAIPQGETWTFDSIVLTRAGALYLGEGMTLSLPNGLASISGGTEWGGLILDGGTLVLPAGDQVISGGWVFQAQTPYVFEGNLTIRDGGRLGVRRTHGHTNNFAQCSVRVKGDLTVETGAFIWARGGGMSASGNYESSGAYIFNGYFSHGGQTALQPEVNSAYDSVFNPTLPGSMGTGNDGQVETFGGGVVSLTVDGTLRLDGEALADALVSDSSTAMGSGGTLNFTLGRLTGSGRIAADGKAYKTSSSYDPANLGLAACRGWTASSGGGRIAVRLTGEGADFSEFPLSQFSAKGGEVDSGTEYQSKGFSGAGTVYLQSAAEADCGGTILVRNTGNALNTTGTTPLPSPCWGGENDVFDEAKLQLEANAIVKLYDSFRLRALALEEGCSIDLNGATLRVKSAGRLAAPGTYSAASGLAWLRDSSEAGTGSLIVEGTGTVITIY